MSDSRGERLSTLGMDIAIWPMDKAEKRIPRGPMRFFGAVLAFPFTLLLMLICFPFVVAGLVLQFWDHCHK